METTVRSLATAIVRHAACGVTLGAAAISLFVIDLDIHDRYESAIGVLGAWRPGPPATDTLSRLADALPASAPTFTVVAILMLAAGLAAAYHAWQWDRKTRRYLTQRRRSANELLRADFRRTHWLTDRSK